MKPHCLNPRYLRTPCIKLNKNQFVLWALYPSKKNQASTGSRIENYPQLICIFPIIDLFENLPQNVAEELGYYVLQAAFGVIHHYCMQCDPELDDQVLVQENCQYLNGVLKVIHKIQTCHIGSIALLSHNTLK